MFQNKRIKLTNLIIKKIKGVNQSSQPKTNYII